MHPEASRWRSGEIQMNASRQISVRTHGPSIIVGENLHNVSREKGSPSLIVLNDRPQNLDHMNMSASDECARLCKFEDRWT